MTLTIEQRAELARQNGRMSRGPISQEGKDASRRNALKHGLRAEVLSLPNEDPAHAAERQAAWDEYYRPDSPATQHLVNECVRATLLSDRCHAFHDRALTDQVLEAESRWHQEREDRVMALIKRLKREPAEAVRLLRRTGHGCRWLLGRWAHLAAELESRGYWCAPERDEAIRLMGHQPELDQLKDCPEAWLMRAFNQRCHRAAPAEALRPLFDPEHQPEAMAAYRADALPAPSECRALLLDFIAEQAGPIREEEARLLAEFEDAELAGVADRALILRDEKEARRFLRYHAESRIAFHRAYSALMKALKQGEPIGTAGSPNEPAEEAVASSPNEPTAPAPVSPNEPTAPVAPRSPNEPTRPASSGLNMGRGQGIGAPDSDAEPATVPGGEAIAPRAVPGPHATAA